MVQSQQTLGPSAAPLPKPHFAPKPATPEPELNAALQRLRDNAAKFAQTSISQKISWLREIAQRSLEVAPEQVAAACRAKGVDEAGPLAGEEWLAGVATTLRNVRYLIEALTQIGERGTPTVNPRAVIDRAGGVAVRVTPHDGYDKTLFAGLTCDVWLGSGVRRDSIAETQASFYKQQNPKGGVSLILGAGNVASIPPMDVLYKMFVEGNVCLLKMNPVNEYVGPFLQRSFKPLIDAGFLVIVYGGGDVGAYLCQHPLIDDIHITGSDKTHDLIVWGPPGPEREDRKRRRAPILTKRITSELGNVSPVMVVPGPYSDAEIDFMAQNIAGMITNNASFNCNAAKLLILPSGWPLRDRLLKQIGDVVARVPPRKAYYPGAKDRYRDLTEGRSGVRKFGAAGPDDLPWTLVPGLDANDASEKNFYTEPFCSILSETQIGSTDPAEFVATASKFANDRVWGTLNAMFLVSPRVEADPAFKSVFDQALRDLRYGTIGINHWPALVYALGNAPWGGHQSATLEDIQSGLGWVHNTLMFEDIDKSVVRGPMKGFPKPAWFPGHKTLHRLAPAFASLEAAPSWTKVPSIALMGLRG
jgi:acyl-CoA reductase-like NAD-dependent aldehyde dehydrogenase